MSKGKIFIAKETFGSAYTAEVIRKGVTRVREGHILLEKHPSMFEPIGEDQPPQFEVATAEPVFGVEESPLMEQTRRELDALAVEAGVAEPDKMPSKAAVASAIIRAQQP